MIRTETISLDGRTYLTTQYAADPGFMLFIKLVKLLGEGIFKLIFFGDKSGLEGMQVDELIGPLLEKLDPSGSLALVKEILGTTRITENGTTRELNFTIDFAGRYLHLFKLVGAVVRFQYADFLAGNATAEEPVAEKIKALK
ncbi:MAG TPA: hypothetical protein VFW62_11690 [bacterium]|nr:hypothetical protein [bacterium]